MTKPEKVGIKTSKIIKLNELIDRAMEPELSWKDFVMPWRALRFTKIGKALLSFVGKIYRTMLNGIFLLVGLSAKTLSKEKLDKLKKATPDHSVGVYCSDETIKNIKTSFKSAADEITKNIDAEKLKDKIADWLGNNMATADIYVHENTLRVIFADAVGAANGADDKSKKAKKQKKLFANLEKRFANATDYSDKLASGEIKAIPALDIDDKKSSSPVPEPLIG